MTLYKKNQNLFSKLAEQEFLNGIADSDVVFYIGHSRKGGGPYFYPPVLTKSNKVDFINYLALSPKKLKMII